MPNLNSFTTITNDIWNGRSVAEMKIWDDLFNTGKRVIFWLEYDDDQPIAIGACVVTENACCTNCRHMWEVFDWGNDNEVIDTCEKLWIYELKSPRINICPEFED